MNLKNTVIERTGLTEYKSLISNQKPGICIAESRVLYTETLNLYSKNTEFVLVKCKTADFCKIQNP